VFHRVPIQPRDAREASDVFYNQHQGDVLLNYENEVFMTNNSYEETGQGDKVLPYVVPQKNVRVQSGSLNSLPHPHHLFTTITFHLYKERGPKDKYHLVRRRKENVNSAYSFC